MSMKEIFGQEDIDEYSAQVEAAPVESLKLTKEEKKCRKAKVRIKLM